MQPAAVHYIFICTSCTFICMALGPPLSLDQGTYHTALGFALDFKTHTLFYALSFYGRLVTEFLFHVKKEGILLLTNVIKRDGRVVNYDRSRIVSAIYRACKASGIDDLDLAQELGFQVEDELKRKYADRAPSVEDIQDIVEKTLMERDMYEVAKRYILYREQRHSLRSVKKVFFDAEKIFEEYMDMQDWRVKENSNMNYSLQGLNNHIVSLVTSKYWLERIYPEEIREAHNHGEFHIHDLNILGPYCCGWNLPDLLTKGFGGVSQKVESQPAKHFRVALMQVVNYCYTLQGEAAGAQAFSNFDTYLAPFIGYDGLSYGEVVQCMQEFVFNLNVPTRVGFQTPFVNITMDVNVPDILKNEPVIIGGKFQDKCYGDFQREMDMLNKAFAQVMLEGDAKGRIFSFPIPTYNISPDFPWGSEVSEKIMSLTGKYGAPYFANFISSGLSPDDVRSMCCRLRLDNRELIRRGGGLFGANPLTGSIGVVTVNLPRIGYLCRTKSSFMGRLKYLMDLAKQSLLVKRRLLERMTESGLYPYSRVYLADVKDGVGEYWYNHFNTIGILGMHESVLNFLGCGIETQEGREFALEVLDFMREQLMEYQEETGYLFNLEATPAEGASYRLASLDKEAFPDIKTSGSSAPYYTNSTQLPVSYTSDIITALAHQEELQNRYTGGTVFHGFLGEKVTDTRALELLIRRTFEQFKIPYFTVTPTFSICPDCGYIGGEHWTCPICSQKTEVWSRVVGFYRPVDNWNPGKRQEFEDRLEFAPPKAGS